MVYKESLYFHPEEKPKDSKELRELKERAKKKLREKDSRENYRSEKIRGI